MKPPIKCSTHCGNSGLRKVTNRLSVPEIRLYCDKKYTLTFLFRLVLNLDFSKKLASWLAIREESYQ